jgi:hypothetical protein
MSTQTVPVASHPALAPEILAFAREQGVEQYLQPLIELTRQVYPTATQFKVFVEEDGEIAESFIVFELDVPLDVQQSREADHRWHEGWMRIEPYPVSCVFRKSAYPRQ